MKTIIAGKTDNALALQEAIKRINWEISEFVVSSNCLENIKKLNKNKVPVSIKEFAIDNSLYSKDIAIHIRDVEMVRYADAIIYIWDGIEQNNLMSEAKELGLKIAYFLEAELINNDFNPIKSNPIFGNEATKANAKDNLRAMATKTISLNEKTLVVYEDPTRNQPIVNMIIEIVNEINNIKYSK